MFVTLSGVLKTGSAPMEIPCQMVMQRTTTGWEPKFGGWGLTHTETGETVSPLDLVSDELIELSDWELQYFAIQIVRDHLEKEECQIIFTL